ncbi:MAG: hypothetical protein AB7P03_27355 [Kofleriaceae bacterium]
MMAPVELVRELLFYRDNRVERHREWGLLAAFLAGSSFAMPYLAPLAIGSAIALGMHKLRSARQRKALVGIDMPLAAAAEGATTMFGIARRFRNTIASLVDGAPVLLEHAVLKDKAGAVLLRRADAVPFLLDVESELPVLVTGNARVTSPNVLARRIRVCHGDSRLERMGVPMDLGVCGELEISSVLADGPGLAVTGVVEQEAVAELAFHRDGGRVPVVRGRAGAPVLVEDRRLIAASL